jgi:putative spermidine/putrescine transport system substrate-binding protein
MSVRHKMHIRFFTVVLISVFVLAACAQPATPEVVEVTKEVVVEVTKEVIKEVEKLVTTTPVPTEDPGELTIVSVGGSYQDAQDTAFFTPFSNELGVRVLQDTNPDINRIKAMVDSGNIEFDVATGTRHTYELGVELGLFEPVDYSYFRPEDLEAMSEEIKLEFGVGTIYYSQVISYDTRVYPEGSPHPTSWADLWDVEKFPGTRVIPSCEYGDKPLPEIAVLAAGVPIDEIYPIDMDLAIEKVKEIAPNAIFYDTSPIPGQMLTDQVAVMAESANGRIQRLIDAGVPLAIEWNQGRLALDYWFVVKGSPNKENAMKFLAFASRPEQQAIMAKLTGYAPTNLLAYELIDEASSKKLSSYPENKEVQFEIDWKWWKENKEIWAERCLEALLSE